jgi:DNA-binding MarR family transcriptional regulator
MERLGRVTRERDPGDRRVQRVLLTPAGETLFVRRLLGVLAANATRG